MASPACAETAQKETPYRSDSGLTKIEYLLSAGQYSAAIQTTGEVLQRHPDSADAYTYRGYAYMHLGDGAAALKDFRRAIKLEPTHLGANKYLGTLYVEVGDTARAIEQLQVLRMTCGNTDCEELRALQGEIDRARNGEKQTSPEKKQD